MVSSPSLLLLLIAAVLAFLSPSAVVASSGDLKRTHIRVYVHERFSAGPNATVATVAPSPLGDNSTFGEVGALDDELRAGPDAASPLVGRYRGVFVGSDLEEDNYISAITIVFDAGKHRGSTLSLQGQYTFPGDDTLERAVVGGTGRFRMAQGYSLLKVVDTPPEASVFQLDLFVYTPRARY
ncbi:hypothetical protein EJB05_11251, partial [Eragrostis curvula]